MTWGTRSLTLPGVGHSMQSIIGLAYPGDNRKLLAYNALR
jgi:hypothetical protein